jgi:hypothetical protein
MALIGGLLIVGIGVFILGLMTVGQSPSVGPPQGDFDSLFVLPLEQGFVTIYFAFFAAAPIWLLFYLPCHLLIPRTSVLWRPWACVPLGALAGAAAYWAELAIVTWGHDLNNGPWIQYQAILAAFVGACTCLAGSTIVKRWREKERRTLVVGSEQR